MKFLCSIIAFGAIMIHQKAQAIDHHRMTRIIGENIELAFHDHGIAGSVKERLVYGSQFKDKFGSKVHYRDMRGKEFTAEFSKKDEKFMGKIMSFDGDNNPKQTHLVLLKVDKEKQEIYLNVNNEKVIVGITADGKEGHHFINPRYSLIYQGEYISFSVEDGRACYGCSINLICWHIGEQLESSSSSSL